MNINALSYGWTILAAGSDSLEGTAAPGQYYHLHSLLRALNTMVNGHSLSVLFRWTRNNCRFRSLRTTLLLVCSTSAHQKTLPPLLLLQQLKKTWALNFESPPPLAPTSTPSLQSRYFVICFVVEIATGSATTNCSSLTKSFNMAKAVSFITTYSAVSLVLVVPLQYEWR